MSQNKTAQFEDKNNLRVKFYVSKTE